MPERRARFIGKVTKVDEHVTDLPGAHQVSWFRLAAVGAQDRDERMTLLMRQPFEFPPDSIIEVQIRSVRDAPPVTQEEE